MDPQKDSDLFHDSLIKHYECDDYCEMWMENEEMCVFKSIAKSMKKIAGAQ
jgi:hypothetical protein